MTLKVSFPNFGNSWVIFKALLESAPGVEVVLPPPVTRKTIELGAKYSPEFVCLPFKVNMGDFIQTYEQQGIKIFINAVDCGPCRLGFYHSIQQRILKDLGYDFEIVPIDQGDLLDFKWIKTFDYMFKKLGQKNQVHNAIHTFDAAVIFFRKAKLVEDMENLECYFRCRETKKGTTTNVMKEMMLELDRANTATQIKAFRKRMIERFKAIPHDEDFKPLKVILAGENHVVLEPACNLDLKRKIGDMGVEVHQSNSIYDWVLHKLHFNAHRRELARIARPYFKYDIGGEAQWVLGDYLMSKRKGFDGFVHIYPFTCMPEVTARSIMTAMDKPKTPVIFFSFDEHSGTEGMKTRLEAFTDLMEGRRDKGTKIMPEPEYANEPSILERIDTDSDDVWRQIFTGSGGILELAKVFDPSKVLSSIFPQNQK